MPKRGNFLYVLDYSKIVIAVFNELCESEDVAKLSNFALINIFP